MCLFHERQCDICRRRAYSQGFAKAVHMSNDRNNFDPAFKLLSLQMIWAVLGCLIDAGDYVDVLEVCHMLWIV